jgi:predicted nucleic acid-binding Zn ribbon protein
MTTKPGAAADLPPDMSLDTLATAAPKDADVPSAPRSAAPATVPMTQNGQNAAHEIVRAALSAKGSGTVELRLDPSDLGKLDIEFTLVDDRLTIAVRAEREDALDLMRRSSDELARLLRQAGVDFDGLDFSRREGREGADESPLGSLAIAGNDGDVPTDIPASSPLLTTADTRVDIRI